MINKNRIVPITRIDLLTLVGLILGIGGTSYTVATASNVEGDYAISSTGTKVCDQPVRSINFTGASGTVYFVPSYDYKGMTYNGSAATITGSVVNDGATVYKATQSTSSVTIVAVCPVAS